jgi:hypothetical protein
MEGELFVAPLTVLLEQPAAQHGLRRQPSSPGLRDSAPAQVIYRWRVFSSREEVAKVLISVVYDEVTHPNFKNSVKDPALHDMYALWWGDHRAYHARVGNPVPRFGLAQRAEPEDLDAPFFDGVRQQRPKAHHD